MASNSENDPAVRPMDLERDTAVRPISPERDPALRRMSPEQDPALRRMSPDVEFALDQYDFFYLYVFDVNTIPKGRLVDKKRLLEILRNDGLGLNADMCYFIPPHTGFGSERDPGDFFLMPDLSTLAKSQDSVIDGFKVGQIICDLTVHGPRDNPPNYLELSSPRSLASQQINKLRAKGYIIQYYYEMEFTLRTKEGSFVEPEPNWGNMISLKKHQKMMLEFIHTLYESKVFCASLHPEAGPSQFEFVLHADQDLKGADMAARFKKEATVFFEDRGFIASFLSYSVDTGKNIFRTMHLNHFLKKLQDGSNVFVDGPLGISETAKRWVAGIGKHLPALMALLCPTENCYQRFIHDNNHRRRLYYMHKRRTCIRRKRDGPDVYLENRLPSNASNPYLVLAGTIAAGMHSIIDRNIEYEETEIKLPLTLSAALDKLDEDDYLKNELGEDFVALFIDKKRQELKNHS